MFGRLGADFQGIAEKMASMQTTLAADDVFIRALASVDLEASIAQWAEIRVLITEFLTNAPLQWTTA